MRIFQDTITNCYYWNDKNLRYLHEKVLIRNIGIYKGFFSEYGQALRINDIDFIKFKEIIKKVKKVNARKKDTRKKNLSYIKDIYETELEKVILNRNKISYLNQRFDEYFSINALDYKFIRAG